MTQSDDSTMAADRAADSSFKEVGRTKKSKRLKATPVQKIHVTRAFKYTIRVYFPAPRAKTKFNPSTGMTLLFKEMLKYDSSITVENLTDTDQIQLASDAVPTDENEFKKYFTVSTDARTTGSGPQIIVGCHLTSERTIRDMKFDTTKPTKLVEWLTNAKIFLESDSLGMKKTATIGYLAKLHPHLTSRTHLKPLLLAELSDITIDPELACELDPSQKTAQLEAMANGDMFIPSVPPFEIYKTHISYGRDKTRVKTDIIGIKCSIDKARLLKEFFNQLSNPLELDPRIRTFVPTGAVHLLGPDAYTNLICDHNSFLQSVATVPVGDFQHDTLDIPFSCDASNDIEQTTINDLILEQQWCLNVERTTTPNKVLIVTTKGQLTEAHEWIDNSLPALYTQHVDAKLDVTTLKHLIPRRLDKPNLTSAAWTYAKKLKLRTNYSTSAPPMGQFNHPPKARNTKHPHLTFDPAASPPTLTKSTPQAQKQQATIQQTTTATSSTAPFDYQAELKCITYEIENNLKAKFEAAIANVQKAVAQLDQKLEDKLQQHINNMKTTQADKATQEKHTREFENITRQLGYLVDQMSQLIGKPFDPMPRNGIGRS